MKKNKKVQSSPLAHKAKWEVKRKEDCQRQVSSKKTGWKAIYLLARFIDTNQLIMPDCSAMLEVQQIKADLKKQPVGKKKKAFEKYLINRQKKSDRVMLLKKLE